MINIDIRKAFDSISWSFLQSVLTGLGFPEVMIHWIMVCITTPKYSISFNGGLHGYFKGERGLRQGDPLSPYLFILGMDYLSRSLTKLKEDRNFKFHPKCKKLQISHLIFADDLLLFAKGETYSVHKLYQCFKTFGEVSGLEANTDRKIDELCRIFLWGKDEHSSKVPLVAWDKVCLGMKQGGLGIYSAQIWNSASALRSIWFIHSNKESLWIKWIHENYLKHEDIWQVEARSGDSWMWKQLLRIRNKVMAVLGGADNTKTLIMSSCKNSTPILSILYMNLSATVISVPWYKTVWGGLNVPKHSFISWLAIQNRLLTQDRLLKRGIISSNQCCLCTGQISESRDHLFFECTFSSYIWNSIMDWMNFKKKSCNWNQVWNWFSSMRGKSLQVKLRRLVLTTTIYCIWRERNARLFTQKISTADHLIKVIMFEASTIILNNPTNRV
ncbi:uncharacterized protein LOC109831192 [Asparagus officinalis]|uniref:uncharacterized protein LOC109831192 n=1 Tax=Asparagus officinalis TaxID=4686 RepID=UPI00098E84F1|nr:uncharacterized protein LOC109831192 [Asparagus officinalis]